MTLRHKLAIDYYLGTFLHLLLKPPTVVLGMLLRRNHDLSDCSSVTIIKLLGGGSLVIAYPSLLALKNSPRIKTLRLVTTPAIRPFAEILGLFDEIIVIRDTSLATMLVDSVVALRKLFLCSAIVDLEVHSRLSTVFSLLTCARNRIGFYTSIAFFRKRLSTHLVFCNVSNGIYYFYDQVAHLFGCTIPEVEAFRSVFNSRLPALEGGLSASTRRIAVAPCCSELSKERMLTGEEWVAVLRQRLGTGLLSGSCEIYLLGALSDSAFLGKLARGISNEFPGIKILAMAGRCTLAESVALLAQMDLLFCIDSALLHFARLIGVSTVSYWGPTAPSTLLRPGMVNGEEVFYRRLSCSPCVHLAERPPCNGEGVCMRVVAGVEAIEELNPTWLVSKQPVAEGLVKLNPNAANGAARRRRKFARAGGYPKF